MLQTDCDLRTQNCQVSKTILKKVLDVCCQVLLIEITETASTKVPYGTIWDFSFVVL